MESPRGYRGPPPRRDLVASPSRERDWKGNDLFGEATNNIMNEEQRTETPANLALNFGPNEEYIDPHLKSQRDYGSDYAKLAMQGGHRDLLHMDNNAVDNDSSRKQKGCENVSQYNKKAMEGGQKDLLSTTTGGELDQERKHKGCDNVSDYNRIALQGGHKDLLVIAENKPTNNKVEYSSASSDWFSHGSVSPQKKNRQTSQSSQIMFGDEDENTEVDGNSSVNGHSTIDDVAPTKQPSPPRSYRPSAVSTSVIGDRDNTPQRTGRKRFEQSNQKRDAPFATYW